MFQVFFWFSTFLAVVLSVCVDSKESRVTYTYGYWDGDKTDANKELVLKGLDKYKELLDGNPNNTTFSYINQNIVSYMWMGKGVQNSGYSDIIGTFKYELNRYGIPNLGYMEYIEKDNPDKTFGIAFDTGGVTKLGNLRRAAKLWSQGRPYNTNTGLKSYPNKAICYLDYIKYKKFKNNYDVGACLYKKWVKGSNPSDICGGVNYNAIYDDYNYNLDFETIPKNYPVCCSVGNIPNLKPKPNPDGTCYKYKIQPGDRCRSISANFYPLSIDEIDEYNINNVNWKGCNIIYWNKDICVSKVSCAYFNSTIAISAFAASKCIGTDEVGLTLDYKWWKGDKTDANKEGVLKGLAAFKRWLNQTPNEESFKYVDGNIVGYMWVGSMIQNSGFANNIITMFEEEVKSHGFPSSAYLEYVNGDPFKGLGVAFQTGGKLSSVQRAVKLWSQGKKFETFTGSKQIAHAPVCYLSYSNRTCY